MTTPGSDIVGCPITAMKCNETDAVIQSCFNGGTCCEIKDLLPKTFFCACPSGFGGNKCEVYELYDALGASERTMNMISLSAGISIAVGLIALLALGAITFVIVRSARNRRPWGPLDGEPDLDKTIVYVQEEISKLSTVQQLNKLQRLSKLFEKTVREAILSEPGQRIDRPKSVVMNEYLPRWSSAPTCINRPPNDMDMPDGGPDDSDEVFQKPRLQQVFSLQAPIPFRQTSRL